MNPKKVAKLAEELKLPVVAVLVRGGTGHRQDLCLADGSVVYYWPRTGQMEKTDIRHTKVIDDRELRTEN